MELNQEQPIAVYSIGKKGESTYGVNIDDDYELGLNEIDLIVYLKIDKID